MGSCCPAAVRPTYNAAGTLVENLRPMLNIEICKVGTEGLQPHKQSCCHWKSHWAEPVSPTRKSALKVSSHPRSPCWHGSGWQTAACSQAFWYYRARWLWQITTSQPVHRCTPHLAFRALCVIWCSEEWALETPLAQRLLFCLWRPTLTSDGSLIRRP